MDKKDNKITRQDLKYLIKLTGSPCNFNFHVYMNELTDEEQTIISKIQDALHFSWGKLGFGNPSDFMYGENGMLLMIAYKQIESNSRYILSAILKILSNNSVFSKDDTALLIRVFSEVLNKI